MEIIKIKNNKLPETPEVKKLQRELAKRQAIEESQKEMAEIGKKRAELKAKVKALRWKQSALGKTVETGKRVFTGIGTGLGKFAEGLEKAGKSLEASDKEMTKSMKGTMKKKKKMPKPIDMESFIAGLPA